MESQCHKGTDLIEIVERQPDCRECGAPRESKLVGYRCRCGKRYALDFMEIPDVALNDDDNPKQRASVQAPVKRVSRRKRA